MGSGEQSRTESAATLAMAAFLAVVAAVLVAVSSDWPPIHRLALLAAGPGAFLLVIMPNPRLALAAGWIFLHPLAIERVFVAGTAFHPDFFPPVWVFSASDVALILLILLLLLERLSPGNRQPGLPAAALPLFLMGIWGAALTLRSGTGAAGILGTLHLFKMAVFVTALSLSIRNRREFRIILVCMGAAVALQAAFIGLSLARSSTWSFSTRPAGDLQPFSGEAGESILRATGTVGHTNEEAAFLTFFGLPLTALLAARNAAWRWSASLLLAVTGLSLVLTYSRSAWLSVSLGVAGVVWANLRRRRLIRMLFAWSVPVLCLCALVGAFDGQKIYERLVHGDEGATASRKRSIDLALALARIAPLTGVGPGGFAKAALEAFPVQVQTTRWRAENPNQSPEPPYYGRLEVTPMLGKDGREYAYPLLVHNKVLLVLTEEGAVGLSLFFLFLLLVLRQNLAMTKSADPWTARMASGLLGAFLASLAYMQLDLFANDKSMEILLTVPALILALGRMTASGKTPAA